jgi:catechol 2,3-dioxygenase-like lactoylglutathione lyase family enzyme
MMPHTPVLGNLSPLIPAGSDVEATLAFYVHKLGFTTIHKDGEPTEMAIIQRDAVEIFLCRNDDRYVAAQTSFRIHVQHVEQLYGEYQAQGVIHPNGQLTTKPWGTQEFAILDPAGVCITFYEPVAQRLAMSQ